ncbi:hypothetical protein TYRP_006742, partial [Tyrophagus putrescentiae]
PPNDWFWRPPSHAINRYLLFSILHGPLRWRSDEPSELTMTHQLICQLVQIAPFSIEKKLCTISTYVRWGIGSLDYDRDHIPLLCQQFPSLTTLSVSCTEIPQLPQLFTTLTQLQQLVHLQLDVDLRKCLPAENRPSLAQLTSLRALDLGLYNSSHSQVQWLNLQWTLPSCQVIRFLHFECLSCKTIFWNYDNDIKSFISNHADTLNCLSSSFSGVSPERISFGSREPFFTFAQVMTDMKVMTDAGKPLPDYITTSRWNCLVLGYDVAPDPSTTELIVNTFSAVTDLKFTIDNQKVFAIAERLLQHPQWTSQLSSLLVYHANTKSLPNELVRPLIAAINRLPALQYLAVKWDSEEPSELTILNQLKVIVFNNGHSNVPSFLNSLEHHAIENVSLQMHFTSRREEALPALSSKVAADKGVPGAIGVDNGVHLYHGELLHFWLLLTATFDNQNVALSALGDDDASALASSGVGKEQVDQRKKAAAEADHRAAGRQSFSVQPKLNSCTCFASSSAA